MEQREIYNKLISFGLSDVDAKVLLDCILSGKPCSWVNNDAIKPGTEQILNDFMRDFFLSVNITYVETRNKYLWEVSRLRKRATIQPSQPAQPHAQQILQPS